MLASIAGEFGIVADPEIKFGDKGNAWLKMRCVAKDRVRDSTGQWSDGDPCFVDVIVNHGAENLFESVVKGDSVIVIGVLKQREYEVDGQKRTTYQIKADSVGVSVRWGTAKTAKSSESKGSPSKVLAEFGAQEVNAPF